MGCVILSYQKQPKPKPKLKLKLKLSSYINMPSPSTKYNDYCKNEYCLLNVIYGLSTSRQEV